MKLKVEKFLYKNKELLKEAFKIRKEVFTEEQNTREEEEFDGLDVNATHFLIFSDGNPVGTSRVRTTNEGIKIERFAIRKKFRGKYIGAKLFEEIMQAILPLNQKTYLNSQVQAMKFYEKFGFKKTGKLFFEANIKHCKMVYSEKR